MIMSSLYARQWTGYTCFPACVRRVFDYYGQDCPEWETLKKKLRTTSKGTYDDAVQAFYKKNGWQVRRIRQTCAQFENALHDQRMVHAAFYRDSGEAHAVVVWACTKQRVKFYDPSWGFSLSMTWEEYNRRKVGDALAVAPRSPWRATGS